MNKKSLSFLGRNAAALRNALDAVFTLFGFPPLAADIDGVRLYGFLRHRSILEQFAGGSYESATRRVFRELLPSADVLIDVGAHIGLFSVLGSRYGNPGLAVYAFEPDPHNRCLRREGKFPCHKKLDDSGGSDPCVAFMY